MNYHVILNPDLVDERVFELADQPLTIGRAEENRVAYLNRSLSRQHARLEQVNGRVFLTDLNSKNGTYVDGQRVERCELLPGSSFRCGEVRFRLGTPETAPTLVRALGDTQGERMEDLLVRGKGQTTSALRLAPGDPVARTRHELRLLLKVSELLSSPEPLDALLEKILSLVLQLLDVDRAVLLLADPATGELRPHLTRTAEGVPTGGRAFSRRIVEYVRMNRVAALFHDAQQDPRVGEATSVLRHSIRASVCVPLMSRDALLGVLYLDSCSGSSRFTAEDLHFLTAFANQAAIALENARLYARLEEAAVQRSQYRRFFPPSTLRRLEDARGAPLEGMEGEVTALFADISGFTRMCSALSPRQVVELLNEYFEAMADVVFRHEGTLEKYMGDGLRAVWGAPFPHPDDADRALRAAVDMQQALRGLNARWRARGQPELQIHIGLATGPAAAANIGSGRFLQYALVGDVTAVASHLCALAPPGHIHLARSTFERLAAPRWPLKPLAPLLRGDGQPPIPCYDVRWADLAS